LLFYFFLYIFLLLSYIVWFFISKQYFNLHLLSIVFYSSLFLNVLMYFYLSKVDFFKENKVFIRIISFLFWYIASIILVVYYTFYGLDIKMLFLSVYLIVFNFSIHRKFENYISFFFSLFLVTFIIYFFYCKLFYIWDDGLVFLILSLFLSFKAIILTYFYKFKYSFDYYFFHIYSYIINIVSITIYLILFKIDLFTLGIILFVESIYIFLSYYRLKQIKN
jgi:hypothetical protein